ncbi:MAG: AAA family ATPase [Clostridiales bacterium]|nr:AAA family ATPase [Clostridiales bacterium]
MLGKLIPLVEQQGTYLAVTRPRRFGKSVAAAMIGSFFGKGVDGTKVFSCLKISEKENYKSHLNQHNLIYIDFSRDVADCSSYEQYIKTIKKRLIRDLRETYSNVEIDDRDSMGAVLRIVSLANRNEKFIMVFDEWDYVFHRSYFTNHDRGRFTAFLGDMTKGRAYVEMAYLTSVLPIKKYSVSDTMNHFDEYNMANSDLYDEYFGFTGEETDELYQRYLHNCVRPAFSRKDLEDWYDGYQREDGNSIYNPNSVVTALTRNKLQNYWAKAGEYDELKDYVMNDIDGVRDAVMLLAAGEPVNADISEYASTASVLKFRDEILSVMTVYGYLNYCNGCVRIPNREVELEFEKIIRKYRL